LQGAPECLGGPCIPAVQVRLGTDTTLGNVNQAARRARLQDGTLGVGGCSDGTNDWNVETGLASLDCETLRRTSALLQGAPECLGGPCIPAVQVRLGTDTTLGNVNQAA